MSEPTPARPSGTLYLVATPIGNLEDITARALRILREVDIVAAEDTRVTRKLLAHFDIHTPLTAYHEHTTEAREDHLLAKLASGTNVALVSDAGTPAISDPGADLVAAAAAAGIRVEPIPGACAAIGGLIGSGLPTGRFAFEGFLPRPRSDRRERLAEIALEKRTLVLYEAPHRLRETLQDLRETLGDERPACVARELTKKFEEWVRGTLKEIADHFAETEPRGECVILISGNLTGELATGPAAPDAEALARAALERGLSPKNAARELSAVIPGLSRNDAYALVVRLRESEE